MLVRMSYIMSTLSDKPSLHDITVNKSAVFAEQTAQLYGSVYSALIATLLNSSVLAAVMWPVISHDVVITWLLSVVIVSLVRAITTYRYNKASPENTETFTWFILFFIGSIFAGLLWAAASIWLFPADSIARQVFLAFVVGGMVAGAITSLSQTRLTIYVYIILSSALLLIRFFTSESELGVAMGSMVTLFLFMMIVAARRTHKNIKQNIYLHLDSIEREQRLQQSENRYQKLLETATDAFFLHDSNGKFVDVNQEACNSLNYTHDELLNLSVPDIEVGQNSKALKELWPKLENGENIRLEGIHRRKDGSTFPVEASVGMIKMNNENFISVLARDVTERQRIDKMKNEFISTVSHELRTPLTSIRGSLGLISGGVFGELPEEMMDVFKIASNNTERLLILVNDILDIQKIESGQMTFDFDCFEIMPFLEQALNDNAAYAEQYNVKFVITEKVDGAKVNADKARMMQVMTNLLSNAAKFSFKDKEVEVALTRHNDGLRISVTDYGMGIPEEFKDKVFEKFTQYDSSDTRQKGGTGLGLSITKLIIESHGGHIGFTSKEGEATIFYVDLPEWLSET